MTGPYDLLLLLTPCPTRYCGCHASLEPVLLLAKRVLLSSSSDRNLCLSRTYYICCHTSQSREGERERSVLHVSAKQQVRSHAAGSNDPASHDQFATIKKKNCLWTPQAQCPRHHRTHQSQYHNAHKFMTSRLPSSLADNIEWNLRVINDRSPDEPNSACTQTKSEGLQSWMRL